MAKTKSKQFFSWEGKDRAGKKVSGHMEAVSADVVKAQLRKQGISPGKVAKRKKEAGAKKVTPGDIAVFARQLSTMMKAGVPLVQSFTIVAEGTENPTMKSLIIDIKNDVESGISFGEALLKHPAYFDDLFCNLVIAGEQSGALETLLDKVATYKEKSEALKAKIKKAMNYPIAVLIIAFIVSAILLVFVVPEFKKMFDGFGAELPAFTLMVMSLSEFIQAKWYILLGGIVGAVFAFKAAMKVPAFNESVQRLTLRAPIFGEIVQKAAIARFARTLATMSAAGVPLVEALDSAASTAGNIVYFNAIKDIEKEAATGLQVNVTMKQQGIWPTMVVQMIAIGEEAGALDSMLEKVATYYEEQVDNAVDGLTALMEPMIMAFLGVIVGGLVASMYLPIFKMGSAVG